MRILLLAFLTPALLLSSALRSRLSSLDPLSVAEHLAFYEVYPEAPEGKEALAHAWHLLAGGKIDPHKTELSLPPVDIQPVIALVTRQKTDKPVQLSEEQLVAIEKLGAHFHHRTLRGHDVWTKNEVIALDPSEVDLGRGLLLEQFNENRDEVRQYEAGLDLMALQIQARLPQSATHEDAVREINNYIFHEMQFRFPPHALYAKDIDLYTFLPSVMDSREGVCLGVSILYLSLAQRLGLPLEIITPPGHIYVRYRDGDKIINIETTARGVNMPSDIYLGLDTRLLPERNIKEVIGLSYMNQAAVFWHKEEHVKALELYQKARPYLEDDPLLDLFMGLNYLFVGNKKAGRALLSKLKGTTFDWAISSETMVSDYLNGKTSIEGLKTIFMSVDETRESILEKQRTIQKILTKHPKFRDGLLQLAVTWLQLGRNAEAEAVLEKYHKLDPTSSVVEYYLAVIATQRYDYNKAWNHLQLTEELLARRDHQCPALRGLRHHLRQFVF